MIKTETLTANQEKEIALEGNFAMIENRGSAVVYASKYPDVVAGENKVIAISPSTSKVIKNIDGKIYAECDSDGIIEIQTSNDFRFFKPSNIVKGGGGDTPTVDTYTKSEIDTFLGKKVNKESGKGLSSNDFTDSYKSLLDRNFGAGETIPNGSDLNNYTTEGLYLIEYGDRKSILNTPIPTTAKLFVKVFAGTFQTSSKIQIFVPFWWEENQKGIYYIREFGGSSRGWTEWTKYEKQYDDTEIKNSINNKVDKISGKGLSTNDFTDSDKNRITVNSVLISEQATSIGDIRGRVDTIENNRIIVYVDDINGDDNNDGLSDSQKLKTVNKALDYLKKTPCLEIVLSSGEYQITSSGVLGNSILFNKTLFIRGSSSSDAEKIILNGAFRNLYNSCLILQYMTVNSVFSSTHESSYSSSMFYAGEYSQLVLRGCRINNTHYSNAINVAFSKVILRNTIFDFTNNTKNVRYILRPTGGECFLFDCTAINESVFIQKKGNSIIFADTEMTTTSNQTNDLIIDSNGLHATIAPTVATNSISTMSLDDEDYHSTLFDEPSIDDM